MAFAGLVVRVGMQIQTRLRFIPVVPGPFRVLGQGAGLEIAGHDPDGLLVHQAKPPRAHALPVQAVGDDLGGTQDISN